MSIEGILTVTAVGRVKDAPEVKTSQSGKPWASIWLECPKRLAFGARKGDVINLGCRLKLFGERAVDFCNRAKEGSVVAVTGEPQADAWMPRDAQEPRGTLEIRVETFSVISGGYEAAHAPPARGGYSGAPKRQGYSGGDRAAVTADDDSIPF